MPNRILRDCTDSDKVNRLDALCERFFYRLIMIVDDYGRYYAHPGLLKAKVFPLQLDKIRETDITRWMAECQKAGLIVIYEATGKNYFQIEDFRQRLDKAKEKYPPPTSRKSITFDNDFPAETEKKQKLESETKQKVRDNVAFKISELEKLRIDFSEQDCQWMFDKLSAYKLSNEKEYKSDYGAILTWVVDSLKKEKSSAQKETIHNGAQPPSKVDQINHGADQAYELLSQKKY